LLLVVVVREKMASKADKALLKAAEKGKLEGIQAALDSGADMNCQDPKGRSPVYLTVMANSVPCTHELLSRGADPNIADKNKEYPIHIAACFPATDVLRILVDTGKVDLESQNKDGNTALHKAAYAGCVDCVMYLTSKGADSKAQNNKYEIPAALARKKNHKGVLAVMKAAQLREKSGIQGRPVSMAPIKHAENGMPLEPVKLGPDLDEDASLSSSSSSNDVAASGGAPPPPPGGGPPPPPSGGGPPPPPGGAPNMGAAAKPAGGFLGGIANAKLKKTEHAEEGEKPAASSSGSGGGRGGGGGGTGDMMAEMLKKRNQMKSSSGTSFTVPQMKQFEQDLMFVLKDDITLWKKDIVAHLASAS